MADRSGRFIVRLRIQLGCLSFGFSLSGRNKCATCAHLPVIAGFNVICAPQREPARAALLRRGTENDTKQRVGQSGRPDMTMQQIWAQKRGGLESGPIVQASMRSSLFWRFGYRVFEHTSTISARRAGAIMAERAECAWASSPLAYQRPAPVRGWFAWLIHLRA